MTALDVALDYIGRGWSPIPIPHRQKKPILSQWQNLRITKIDAKKYFNSLPQNVGVILGEPSGALVDVDLDCPEALALASSFLPPTEAVFGRASKDRSHWLYTAAVPKRLEFVDPVDGEMLLELRTNGGQTVFPGSTHETGESIEWNDDNDPAPVDPEQLTLAARRLAAACLLARAAPASDRHNYLLYVCGALVRGLGRDGAAAILGPVGRQVLGNRYTKAEGDRLLDDTVRRLAAGEPVPGWPKLAERIGDQRCGKIKVWLGIIDAKPQDQPDQWPEPIDILADPVLTGVATVDETCLPKSILALAKAEGSRLQVDPCHIAALAIGACSAVLSDDWRVQLKVKDEGWTQHPSIWVAVVAESGRKKTDSFRSATRGVFLIEKKMRSEFMRKMAEYKEAHEKWEALPKNSRGEEPKPPAEVRLATDDFTIEVLSDILQWSNKVLLRSDELATMLGAFERYAKPGAINAGRAHMLALYDGGPRRIDRVIRGNIFVPNWSAVPVGHIQPAKVRQLVAGLSDDGLLQRFMIVMPPRVAQRDPDDDDIPTNWTAIDRFAQIVEILFDLRPPETQGPGGKPEYCKVKAEPDVHRIRRQLFRLVERIEADPILPAALKEAASKWRGLLARMSLLFHCIELADPKRSGPKPNPHTLKAATVEKAWQFIRRVVIPSTFRFHTEIGSTGLSESHARWVARYILSRQLTVITARDVGRAYREIRGKTAEIVATMELLDHAGWVLPDLQRPQHTAWLVNPKVHTVFAAQAAAEKATREAVREQIKTSIAAMVG